LGRNGAGKTTLINILITLTRPDAGSALVAGFDVLTNALDVRHRIGVTFQEPLTERLLRGRDLLDLQGQLYGLGGPQRRARIAELARVLELDDVLDQPAKQYSGGMLRRLELARSLITRPGVLFLDEPTVGLDLPGREQFWQYVRQLCTNEGLTVLVTTHALDEAEAFGDRVGILDGGMLIVEGTPAALIAAVAAETVILSGTGLVEPFLAALRACPWVLRAEPAAPEGATRMRAHVPFAATVTGPRSEVVIGLNQAAGSLLKPIITLGEQHGFAIDDVRLQRPGLADVFRVHTGKRYAQHGDNH
jgi:ABC-2 type transport system ATP-binding protein